MTKITALSKQHTTDNVLKYYKGLDVFYTEFISIFLPKMSQKRVTLYSWDSTCFQILKALNLPHYLPTASPF